MAEVVGILGRRRPCDRTVNFQLQVPWTGKIALGKDEGQAREPFRSLATMTKRPSDRDSLRFLKLTLVSQTVPAVCSHGREMMPEKDPLHVKLLASMGARHRPP